MKVLGTEEDPRVYSFVTAGKELKDSSFCVINDTHRRWESFGPIQDKLAALAPSCVIWNGDASNSEEKLENQVLIFLDQPIQRKDYAAETPYLFCPGNHDSRGRANRHLERVWMYRQPEERDVRDWDLGRNFAVRMGEIALIGLDTAEDKLDSNPLYAGLFNSEPYREAQTRWLRDALRRKDFAQAPYIVAFCHIPLYDDNPVNNPGDCAPDDTDPRYTTDYALWQRTCGRMWGPLLQKAGCQLVITGHQHRYRYLAPNSDHSWAEIIGGGPEMKPADRFPTLIEASVEKGVLTVRVHNLRDNSIQDSFSFKPRSVKSSSAQ